MTVKELKEKLTEYDDDKILYPSICFEDWDDPESTQDWYPIFCFDICDTEEEYLNLSFAFKDKKTRKKMVKMLSLFINN